VVTIRKLTKDDDRSSFTCGEPALDSFFREQALNVKKRLGTAAGNEPTE
jgi:hypothetical protein